MFFKLAIICVAFSAAYGAPSAPTAYGAPPPPPPAYGAPLPPPPQPTYAAPTAPEPIPPYAYNYAVLDAETKTDFSAEEEAKDGNIVGQYKVLRADGIIMTVTYTVSGNAGFVAEIATEKAPEEAGPAAGGYGAPVEPAYGAPPAPLPAYLPSYA